LEYLESRDLVSHCRFASGLPAFGPNRRDRMLEGAGHSWPGEGFPPNAIGLRAENRIALQSASCQIGFGFPSFFHGPFRR